MKSVVQDFILNTESDLNYPEARNYVQARKGGEHLTKEEREIVRKGIFKVWKLKEAEDAAEFRKIEDEERGLPPMNAPGGPGRFLVLTSYTTEPKGKYYEEIGGFCASHNRAYCERHGYIFEETILPKAQMLKDIEPRHFCGYHKILLMLQLLKERRAYLDEEKIRYLVWIDADAVIIEPDITLESIVEEAGYTDLIIAEDQSIVCQLNSGIMLIRVGEWSTRLMEAVWEEPKFHLKRHYEQSALCKILHTWGEGLNQFVPFHSWQSGKYSLKHAPHVCVFPRRRLNTRIMDDDPLAQGESETERARFIYHPAGTSDKIGKLRWMFEQRQGQST